MPRHFARSVHLRTRWLSTIALIIATPSSFALAQEEAALTRLLKQAIIEPHIPLAEVQSLIRSRVPPMPQFDTLPPWEAYARRMRAQVLDGIVYRGQAAHWRDAKTRVEWLGTIAGGSGYHIRKLRYEALPGLWIPALLYRPNQLSARAPVVLNVNGHDGDGKAADYKQIRCINQAKRGMLALNVEWLGMGQLRHENNVHYRMNQLDLCGTSGLAPFYLSMKRGIDVLLSLGNADPQRVAVAGLSGGGWQTILISSLDERVALANPVAGYSSFLTRTDHFKDLGDSEQTPNDLATLVDYTHLTAMLAPRAALLTYNSKDDCCFESGYALGPLLKAARPIYALYGRADRLRWHVNDDPGDHNFERDNREALYRLVHHHFFDDSPQFDPAEIACQDELKTKKRLSVPLPKDNATLHDLALDVSESLPRRDQLPGEAVHARQWQTRARRQLRALVRYHDYACVGHVQKSQTISGVHVTHWRLRIGDQWTVPAVEFAPPNAQTGTMISSDQGRSAAAGIALPLLQQGKRVLVVDPFYFGESKIAERDFLFALLVAAVGERPLGIQASQIGSIARWWKTQHDDAEIAVVADGPRSSTFTLIASAVETESIAAVQLRGALGSLRQVIEQNKGANEWPEMFCFGLLEQFDMLQIAALVGPRPITFHRPSDRVRSQLASLQGWYTVLGRHHEPLPK